MVYLLVAVAVLDLGVVPASGQTAVTLHYGKLRPLNDELQRLFQEAAVEMVKSSNFNSIQHADIVKSTPQKVQAAYRDAVRGNSLVVTFEEAKPFTTTGGDIRVVEIVVALNHPQYADALFTVDDQFRVVRHSKYDGGDAVEIMNLVSHRMVDR
jgi:hypothetical protein